MITADEILHRLTIATVKARSNIAESAALPDEIQECVTPWLVGDRNILKACEHLTQRGNPTKDEIANLLIVANDLEPSIALVYQMIWHESLPSWSDWMNERIPQ